MGATQTILIVDDDPHIREVVRFALEKAGYATAEAADGQAALARFAEVAPDLVVLDIVMPELDGTEVCRRLRAESTTPIVFLSSRDDEIDRIVGLELGGDDYVTKPFSPRELVARVRAVLRRTATRPAAMAGAALSEARGGTAPAAGQVTHGQLTLDLDRFVARWGGVDVVLTVTELGILKALMGFPGKVFSRDELMTHAYREPTVVTDRTIDSHVRRIRRKFSNLGGDPVETVHGVGYRLGPCRPPAE